MSRQINQPINQVRLTNVAVVRMNKNGKRFEIACYRNKVMDYRKGLETDLSEVLQTDRIFTNVSKGQFAKHSDLNKAFSTKDEEVIAEMILQKGQLQVSDLERQAQSENTLAQIATWVANHCVHPQSQRPYTIHQIKHALGKQYNVQPHKAIKKQYLDCVKFLKGVIPIERAKMELALSYSSSEGEGDAQLDQLVESEGSLTLSMKTTNNKTTRCVLLADPSLYRVLDDLAKTLPQGKLEILRQVVTQEGDVDLEMEIERKTQLQQQQQQQQNNLQKPQPKEENSSEEENYNLVATQQNNSKNNNNNNADDSEDDGSWPQPQPQNRKKQSDQKKKLSKKAKRRLREQEAEREARAKAEQERQEERAQVTNQPVMQANAAAAQQSDAKPCNTCGGSFPTAAAYRAHFKSDWHRFNQKLKLQGMAPVSEKEFVLCDAESFFGACELAS